MNFNISTILKRSEIFYFLNKTSSYDCIKLEKSVFYYYRYSHGQKNMKIPFV